MKNFSILLAAAVLFFSSCDELKKLTDVEINSDFQVDIPLATQSLSKSANLDGYPFGGSTTLSLADDPELEDYLDLLQSIDLTGYSMVPSGLPEGVTLSTISVMVNDVVFLTATDVDKTSSYDLSDVNQDAIDEFTEGLLGDQEVTVSVGGLANMPFVFTLTQAFETKIIANPL